MTGAQRLKRVFHIGIETCRACAGAVRILAAIEDPVVLERIRTPRDPKAAAVGTGLLPQGRAPPPAVGFDCISKPGHSNPVAAASQQRHGFDLPSGWNSPGIAGQVEMERGRHPQWRRNAGRFRGHREGEWLLVACGLPVDFGGKGIYPSYTGESSYWHWVPSEPRVADQPEPTVSVYRPRSHRPSRARKGFLHSSYKDAEGLTDERNMRLKHVSVVYVVAFLLVFIGQKAAWAEADGRGIVILQNAALIITMDPERGQGPLGVVEGADLVIEKDTITALHDHGKDGPAEVPANAQLVDASDMIVMPGFVDTHNHLWQSAIRGCGTDQELEGWLRDCMFKTAARLSQDDAYAFVRLSTLDLIDTGITTVVDWAIIPPRAVPGDVQALQESRLRYVFVYFDWDCTAEDCSRAAETRKAIIELKKSQIDPDPLGTLQVASHPVVFSEPAIKNMAELAKELGLTFNVHLCTSQHEPCGKANEKYASSISLLERYGAINNRLMTNHAIHLTDGEIGMLAKRGVRVTHSPLSNMRLADGITKLPKMRAAGMRLGLGLDGGANDTSDMFSVMRAAVGLQRAIYRDAQVYPGVDDVIRLATLGGAEVLGLENQIGSLTPGKQADVIVIDPYAINFAPRQNWPSQIVFNGQPRNVKYVFVAGRMLKRDGRVLANTVEAVQRAERAARNIRQKDKALDDGFPINW